MEEGRGVGLTRPEGEAGGKVGSWEVGLLQSKEETGQGVGSMQLAVWKGKSKGAAVEEVGSETLRRMMEAAARGSGHQGSSRSDGHGLSGQCHCSANAQVVASPDGTLRLHFYINTRGSLEKYILLVQGK